MMTYEIQNLVNGTTDRLMNAVGGFVSAYRDRTAVLGRQADEAQRANDIAESQVLTSGSAALSAYERVRGGARR